MRLESEARRSDKNRFFATTARTRETAILSLRGDIRRLQKDGYREEAITKVTLDLIQGLCGFLFNCPLDMLIERDLHRRIPVLAQAQFVSLVAMAREAWATATNKEIRKLTPPRIFRATTALNGAYARFLDEFTGQATDFAPGYRAMESWPLAERLFQHWQSKAGSLGPGDEYQLVDDFADMLGLRDWFEWQKDPVTHAIRESQADAKEGTTNPSLLREKHPAAVWHLLAALQRFDRLTPEQIREIAFEIGLLGQQGLDYASPDKRYRLKSLPGEKFSGLQLMCLMYAGFKRIAPEQDMGMDLNEPFLQALSLYQGGQQTSST